MYKPAVDNNGTAEEILESIDTPSQFEEEVWLPWDAVVWPASELDVGHFPLRVLLPLLQTHMHTDDYEDTNTHLLKFNQIYLLT